MTDILSELSKELGDTVSSEYGVKHWLDTGYPPLNKSISGSYLKGMPSGRIVEMFGPPSCGKTAIATCVMAAAVQKGGFAMFMDHERSFDINLARKLNLDDSVGRFAHLRPETYEESLTRALKTAQAIREREMIPSEAPIVVVFDSLAAMVPQSKSIKELDEMTMADSLALAKATSTTFPILSQYSEEFDMLSLVLNQVRENPGVMYGDSTRTPGGKAPAFYASVRIKLRGSPIKSKESGRTKEIIGQTITAQCVKNKVSAPFQETAWNFLFAKDGSGVFDVTGGLIEACCHEGIMEKRGAYISYEGKNHRASELRKKIKEEGLADELVGKLEGLCSDE